MNKKLALVTGSFDPITNGHMDIISRAAKMFDEVIVLVAQNEEKTYMFSKAERIEIAKAAVEDISNVTVHGWDGYVADFAKEHGACAFVRGIRNERDAAYEQYMAGENFKLCSVDTVLLFSKPEYVNVSSTSVREMLRLGAGAKDIMPHSAYIKAVGFFCKKQ